MERIKNKFMERDIVNTYSCGLSNQLKKKELIRMVVIKFDPGTKKGKAIGQILDGVRRLLNN